MDSIFSQQYEPVEIVVLDDGSTDGTAELMASYGSRVRYFWQEQGGSAAARNAACRQVRGEYIAFQDDDDLMVPERIIWLYDALQRYPSAIYATGGYEILNGEGNLTGRKNLPDFDGDDVIYMEDGYAACLWPKVPIVPHTTLFRRSDGEKIGWFDEGFKYSASDKDFYARLSRLGSLVYVKKVVSLYRRHHAHASIWGNEMRALCGTIQLLEKHLELMGPVANPLRARLITRMSITLKRVAACASETGQAKSMDVEHWVDSGIKQLNLQRYVAYKFYSSLKLPLKRLLYRYKPS